MPSQSIDISPPLVPTKLKGEVSNPTDIRVMQILSNEGPLTRNQLVSKTKIARSTLYDSLLRLILKGFVSKFSEIPRGPGRPKVYFQTV